MITIYGLQSSEDGIVRYIGQTKNSAASRLSGHLKIARSKEISHKSNWIRSVIKSGHEVQVTVLRQDLIGKPKSELWKNKMAIRLQNCNRGANGKFQKANGHIINNTYKGLNDAC